jgi:hypothetical protein
MWRRRKRPNDGLFAGLNISRAVPFKDQIGTGKRAAGSVGLVEEMDVRSNVFLLDQLCRPASRAVGAVSSHEGGLYAETHLGFDSALLRRSDFRRSDGPRGFDIDNRAMIGVDQVVIQRIWRTTPVSRLMVEDVRPAFARR